MKAHGRARLAAYFGKPAQSNLLALAKEQTPKFLGTLAQDEVQSSQPKIRSTITFHLSSKRGEPGEESFEGSEKLSSPFDSARRERTAKSPISRSPIASNGKVPITDAYSCPRMPASDGGPFASRGLATGNLPQYSIAVPGPWQVRIAIETDTTRLKLRYSREAARKPRKLETCCPRTRAELGPKRSSL